jgi:hypothetical protein
MNEAVAAAAGAPAGGRAQDPRSRAAIRRADGGTRTPDPIITSDVLYQLSYVGEVGDGSDRSGA